MERKQGKEKYKMSIFSSNKKKKQPNQEELNYFLSLSSFNSKQEEEINWKFGYLTGNGTYYMFKSGNRAIISGNKKNYNYLRVQLDNSDTPIVYYKIDDNVDPIAIWDDPSNQWKSHLVFRDGVWREPENNFISPEDNGISIIEAVVISKFKAAIKNKTNPDFEDKDWDYVYFGGNQWNIWRPLKERLLEYCIQYNKMDFKEIVEQYK